MPPAKLRAGRSKFPIDRLKMGASRHKLQRPSLILGSFLSISLLTVSSASADTALGGDHE